MSIPETAQRSSLADDELLSDYMTSFQHRHRIQSAGAYLCVGGAHVYWGTVTPMALPAGSTASTLSLLIAVQFTGFLFGVLTAPAIGHRIGAERLVSIAFAVFAVTVSTPVWLAAPLALTAAGAAFGIAAGTLETQVGAMALQHPNGTRELTILEVCFGIGALGFPLSVFLAARILSWQAVVSVFALVAVALSVWWLRTVPTGSHTDRRTIDHKANSSRPRLIPSAAAGLLLVFAFVYAGFETNFANLLPRIAGQEGAAGESLLAVTAFWSGVTIGRLIAMTKAYLLTRLGTIITLTVSLSIVLFVLSQFLEGVWTALPLVLLAGLVSAALFPAALSRATGVSGLPINRMTSYFVAAASLGGAIVAVPAGMVIDRFGPTGLVIMFAAAAALLAVLAAVSGLWKNVSNM